MARQSELSSRPSREEMRDALQLCVGTDEAERMFERQIAAMSSLQHKLADQVEGERHVREQALGELRNALMDEVGAVRTELEAQLADGLRGMQRSLEEAASAHATAAAAEQKRRDAAADAAADASAAARDQRVMQEVATEVRPVMTTQPLRQESTTNDGFARGGGRRVRTNCVAACRTNDAWSEMRGNS